MGAGVDQRKTELRRKLLALRSGMGEERRLRIDSEIARRVLGLPEYEACELLLTYLDVGSEVRTRDIIQAAWDADKIVALPRCVDGSREMQMFRVTSFDQLVVGAHGLLEPKADAEPVAFAGLDTRALALVPGLAFDKLGYRLGYGGGYYDSFLATFQGVAMGLCREGQLQDSLDELGIIDAHDLPVQIVVSERRCLRFQGKEQL